MKVKYYGAVVLMIVLFTAGCNHYGALPKDYGNSYNAAKSGQVLNPEASKNLKPVTGLPGNAADTTMKKYVESFAPTGPAGGSQQAPAALLMTPLSLGAGKDIYGK